MLSIKRKLNKNDIMNICANLGKLENMKWNPTTSI